MALNPARTACSNNAPFFHCAEASARYGARSASATGRRKGARRKLPQDAVEIGLSGPGGIEISEQNGAAGRRPLLPVEWAFNLDPMHLQPRAGVFLHPALHFHFRQAKRENLEAVPRRLHLGLRLDDGRGSGGHAVVADELRRGTLEQKEKAAGDLEGDRLAVTLIRIGLHANPVTARNGRAKFADAPRRLLVIGGKNCHRLSKPLANLKTFPLELAGLINRHVSEPPHLARRWRGRAECGIERGVHRFEILLHLHAGERERLIHRAEAMRGAILGKLRRNADVRAEQIAQSVLELDAVEPAALRAPFPGVALRAPGLQLRLDPPEQSRRLRLRRTRLFLRRHLARRHFVENFLPLLHGIRFRKVRRERVHAEVALLRRVVVAVGAMRFEKRRNVALEKRRGCRLRRAGDQSHGRHEAGRIKR